MNSSALSKLFESHYCKVVWFLSLFVAYFMIPRHLFTTRYFPLAIFFIFGFATMLTCLIRNVKEKIIMAKTYQTSIWGILASILGLTALQLCGLGAAFCGGSIFLGILSAIVPGIAVSFLSQYAVGIVVFSVLMQILAIWQMGCFKPGNK